MPIKNHHQFFLEDTEHQPSQWKVHLAPEMSKTEYTVPVESLIYIPEKEFMTPHQHIEHYTQHYTQNVTLP